MIQNKYIIQNKLGQSDKFSDKYIYEGDTLALINNYDSPFNNKYIYTANNKLYKYANVPKSKFKLDYNRPDVGFGYSYSSRQRKPTIEYFDNNKFNNKTFIIIIILILIIYLYYCNNY